MSRFDFLKTFKIAFGCCLGYIIAQLLNLNYSTSVITITLLSILNTRKETLTTARKRLLAFFGAAFLSFFIFQILYDSLLSIFLYQFLPGSRNLFNAGFFHSVFVKQHSADGHV